jgi:ribosomal protein S18 acetylase RimI-like enzyme
MNPKNDYVAYWSDACRAAGDIVQAGPIVRALGPPGNIAVYGVLQFSGTPDEARKEARQWQMRGAPFSFVAKDDATIAALKEEGLLRNNDFRLVQRTVKAMGPADESVSWPTDATEFMQLIGEVHQVPEEGIWHGIVSLGQMVKQGKLEIGMIHDGKKAVACGALYKGVGNAGMYSFSVLESHRRRGLGNKLATAMMSRADEVGLKNAVAATTPDGLQLSRATGFEAGGVITQMVWFPGQG